MRFNEYMNSSEGVDTKMGIFIKIILVITVLFVILIYRLAKKINIKLTSKLLLYENRLAVYKEKNDMYEQWLRVLYTGKMIGKYLQARGYSHVAIYGLGEAGKILIRDLDRTQVRIDYIIEQNYSSNEYEGHITIKDIAKCDNMKKTDAIIITEFADYVSVLGQLEKRVTCRILALDDLLFSVHAFSIHEAEETDQ